ncbi:MAG: hypothetical protein ABSA12_11705 [Verrucomicrobiia bacterium]|jgi:hypothetical protein
MNTPPNPALHGVFRLPGRAFPSLCALFLAACSTTAGPRVLEVTNRTRLQDVDIADRDYFIEDRASLITYQPQDLGINDQREEFYVRWTPGRIPRSGPRTISLVKFEYRQVARPGVVSEETYVPHGDARKLFVVGGEQFRSGGVVSAWRVSLWDGDTVVAEEKSVLW